ncbi:MAG: hypothetical protein KDD83_10600 [Caldilineaceae bacterium]|nr:hypothetical protein [Caldilineaceae bacterium]
MPAHARHWRRRWPRGTAFAVALLLGFLLFSPPVAADSVPATTYWRVIATIAAATDGDPAALTQAADALAQIDALEAAIFARLYARTASTQAWMNRNRSVRELRRMVRPLHVQMRALLRHHPEFVTPAWF